jgi:hypothetical protein
MYPDSEDVAAINNYTQKTKMSIRYIGKNSIRVIERALHKGLEECETGTKKAIIYERTIQKIADQIIKWIQCFDGIPEFEESDTIPKIDEDIIEDDYYFMVFVELFQNEEDMQKIVEENFPKLSEMHQNAPYDIQSDAASHIINEEQRKRINFFIEEQQGVVKHIPTENLKYHADRIREDANRFPINLRRKIIYSGVADHISKEMLRRQEELLNQKEQVDI